MRYEYLSVVVDGKNMPVRLDNFIKLFENSHIYYKQDYQKAVERRRINFSKLKELSRDAGIPYVLFFAPAEVVDRQITRNNEILFQGVDNGIFSLSGRGNIDVRDINLIIKDIIKRQKLLRKHYPTTVNNPIIRKYERSRLSIEEQARGLIYDCSIDVERLRGSPKKEKAYDYLVECLESSNIFVSRSRKGFMPQSVGAHVRFSGIVVKENKFPSIFLFSSDESGVSDPAGRRIFTLILLLVCLAKGRFVPVTYDSSQKEIINSDEYEIAEEILMPRSALENANVDKLDDIKNLAAMFMVTPRALLVRLKRLGVVSPEIFNRFYGELNDEYQNGKATNNHPWNASDTTKARTYNGIEFTKRAYSLLDNGRLSTGDLRRILLFNKRPKSFLDDLRSTL